jgi:hypothetical protein
VRGCPTQLFGQGRVVLDKDVGDSGEEALHDNQQPGSVDARERIVVRSASGTWR